jgi:hypothetical protein
MDVKRAQLGLSYIDEVLGGLGYTAEQVAELKRARVTRPGEPIRGLTAGFEGVLLGRA